MDHVLVKRLAKSATPLSTFAANRGGMTLLELTLAVPAMAILVLGLGAAIKIAAMSVPDGTSVSDSTLSTARAIDQFAGDLTFATAINSDLLSLASTRQISFMLPDRDGTAPSTETVSYAWSGTAGAPLLRTFNGVTSTVIDNVYEFALTYSKQAVRVDSTTLDTSPEKLLLDYAGTSTIGDYVITSSGWCGQYFLPMLPPNATAWNVTKVQLDAAIFGIADGETLVQIRESVNALPSNTVLAEGKFLESTLKVAYKKLDVFIPGMPMQPVTQPVCLVLKLGINDPSCKVDRWAGGTRYCHAFSTSNSGSTWTEENSTSLRCRIYGTVKTPSKTKTTQYHLMNVHCTLRVGSSPQARLNTTVRILNQPQVSGP